MWLVCVEIVFIINTFHFFKDDPTVLRQDENDFLQSQGYDSDNDKESISPKKRKPAATSKTDVKPKAKT